MKTASDPSDQREREIFLAAVERTSVGDRAAFVASACGGDVGLRQRVEELLREQAEVGTFLLHPALADTEVLGRPSLGMRGGALTAPVSEKSGDRIGRYRLLQQIGEGGCGIVFMAEQEEPVRRRVALKVIKLGMDTRSVIARFEAERQALAMMDHQNIARVLDAGATETGRPYFVMELVRGVRITDYCDENQLTARERLMLFMQVCHAVQHAHQKGIIHRDLKPSNILVTLLDGKPVPKVIDFGIAKATEQRLTEKTLFTEFAAFIGTPAYMSPEQAEMSSLDVDTRSDIYSLGVLLYELLTGKTPFDAEALLRGGLDECRRTIREKEPDRPSTRLGAMQALEVTTTASQRRTDVPRLISMLRGDLDWIVMRCLEKDRTRRYPDASALVLDLQRYLDNEPVSARPPSTIYRMQKLLRRHRLVVGATAAIAITLIAGVVVSTWQAVRARRAEAEEAGLRVRADRDRARAEQERAAARLNEYVAYINLAHQSIEDGNYGRALQLVEKHIPKAGSTNSPGFEWRYLWRLCQGDERLALPTQDGPVVTCAYSPDGQLAAIALRDQVKILNVRTRSEVASLPRGAFSLAFSPNAKSLLAANRSELRVWRTSDWSEQMSLSREGGPLALSADGTLVATQGRDEVTIRDTEKWKVLQTLPRARGPFVFAPDSKSIATDSRDGITIWPLGASGSPVVLQDSTNLFFGGGPFFRTDKGMTFSADGRYLIAPRNRASARGVFVLCFWDTATGEEDAVLPADPEHSEHTSVISALALAPDGRTLATASWDHSVRLWDVANRRIIRAVQGHLGEVWTVAFSPDGQHLLSASKDGGVNLWATRTPPKEDLLPEGWLPVAFSRDSKTLAAVNSSWMLGFFNLATREAEQEVQLVLPNVSPPPHEGPGGPGGPGESAPPHSPPGTNGPPHGKRDQREQRGPPDGMGFGFVPSFALSADLHTLAQGMRDGRLQVSDTQSGDLMTIQVADVHTEVLAMSPDGRVVLTGGWGRPLQWWEPRQTTNALLTVDGQRAVFSPDGRRLAVVQRGDNVQLWDVAKRVSCGSIVPEVQPGVSTGITGLAFSHDARILATTAGMDDVENAIYLWSADTFKLLGACMGHKQPVWTVAFSPDGKTLASTSSDGTVKLWNLTSRQELLSIRQLGNAPRTLMFSPDGRYLVGLGFGNMAPATFVLRAPGFSEIQTAIKAARR